MATHAARLCRPIYTMMCTPVSRIGVNKHLHWHHQMSQPYNRPPVRFNTSSALVSVHCRSIHTTQNLAKKDKGGKKKKGASKIDLSASADTSLLDLQEVKQDMNKALDILKQEYIKSLNIRTSQGSLDHIQVDTPDGKFPLNHLAQIATKSGSMMVVNMSNFPQATEAAAEAIKHGGMNLNPVTDGHLINVPVPKVTKEHRENLAKVAKQMCNNTKVNIRNIRNKYATMIKKQGQGKSKDVVFKLEKQIQLLLDESNKTAGDILAAKTKELLGK